MADTHPNAEKATHETTPGMRRNSDPALEPEHQHTHGHLHHAPGVAPANDVIYTRETDLPLHKHTDGAGNGTPPEYSDTEKPAPGILAQPHDVEGQSEYRSSFRTFYDGPGRIIVHVFFLLLFTGWWIASLILHRNDKNWIIPFLVWLCVTLRIVFWHVPSRYVSNAIRGGWKHSAVVVYNRIPAKLRTPAGAFVTVSAMLVGSFVTEESVNNTRANRAISLLGMAIILFCFWLTSNNRRKVNWRTVIGGMLAQYIIGLFVLRTGAGYSIFRFIADRAGDLLGFAKDGVAFLTDPATAAKPWFFIGVIPAIIFFISLVQVLYYIGFLQWFIKKFATFVFWALGVSGAEAVVAAATPFIGQGESAMLVRPFVPHMTNAEIHQILTCGFATISGSVLVGYIGLGLNKEALVSSCIMSIPASLAISKLRYPETEETLTAGRVVIPDDDEHKAENFLHAFANGAWLGIKIGGTIVASLLCIIAVVGLINGLLTWWGHYLNINDPKLTLQTILGYILFPVAFLLGVPQNKYELLSVSRLIAEKIITNEYNAFNALVNDAQYAALTPRSQLIATYALCGFGNIGSLGIQIGILSQLAPARAGDVSRLAFSALVSGVFSTLTSAAVAGLVVTNQATLVSVKPS
ncbi:sodium/nucleoside cotransporter [Cordyceps fumosorosea ARSEF 2679]|uniref:Sodium/nucleoside cotransporter n=1 Tax=Cordyceps fumosorosea (strain ARSEF 2679) TaxID=1081104 RepID=A0A167VXL2_CORFA|nr:sodium/nucleoside cotransporter [Cordyceps fumosorosea ARSEF 2679]OAA63094.1 sodium/nucleoside cotransporter [Cordyceps fumosorosea ARSEF 2679]